MADLLRVACVQLKASADKAETIERAGILVAHAASKGADLVLLPEKWNGIGPADVASTTPGMAFNRSSMVRWNAARPSWPCARLF